MKTAPPTKTAPSAGFTYTLALGRSLYPAATIRRIQFPVSRGCKYQETIEFAEKVSEQEAIAAVERYLSEPLDAAHFARIRDDSPHGFRDLPFEEFSQRFSTRGACLGGCTFLELLSRRGSGTVQIQCGS